MSIQSYYLFACSALSQTVWTQIRPDRTLTWSGSQLFDTQYVIYKSNIENYLQTKKTWKVVQHANSKYFQRAFDVFWQLICSDQLLGKCDANEMDLWQWLHRLTKVIPVQQTRPIIIKLYEMYTMKWPVSLAFYVYLICYIMGTSGFWNGQFTKVKLYESVLMHQKDLAVKIWTVLFVAW